MIDWRPSFTNIKTGNDITIRIHEMMLFAVCSGLWTPHNVHAAQQINVHRGVFGMTGFSFGFGSIFWLCLSLVTLFSPKMCKLEPRVPASAGVRCFVDRGRNPERRSQAFLKIMFIESQEETTVGLLLILHITPATWFVKFKLI